MRDRELTLFIDASIDARKPFDFTRIAAERDVSHSTHALSPQALLHTFEQTWNTPSPPAFLLSIPGYDFTLGQPISETAGANLEAALEFVCKLLDRGSYEEWSSFTQSPEE